MEGLNPLPLAKPLPYRSLRLPAGLHLVAHPGLGVKRQVQGGPPQGDALSGGVAMSEYISFSRSNPCPICHSKGKRQRCSGRIDGRKVYCPDSHEGLLVAGWSCTGDRTRDDRQALVWEPEGSRPSFGRAKLFTGAGPVPRPEPASKKTLTAREERDGLPPRSDYDRISDDVEITVLRDPHALFVQELGLRLEAAKAMDWRPWRDCSGNRCWVVPEWTLHEGRICQAGWNLRYRKGEGPGGKDKITQGNDNLPAGYRRGFFRPTNWSKGPEGTPIFFPEGASGTTTLAMLGLRCLGRNNNGWHDVPAIAHMVREAGLVEAGVPLVMLADYDPDVDRYDPDNPLLFHFPGRWGARRAAAALARELNAPVRVCFVPHCKGKDARDWFIANQATGTIDQLRERFLAGLREDRTIGPDEYDAVWAEPCYREPSLKPAPAVATEPAQARDYSDLEAIDWEAHREEVGAEFGAARLDLPASMNPCEDPQFVGLQHEDTWNPLEVKKRCGKCCGCLRHKTAINLRVVRLFLGLAITAGCRLFFATLTSGQWAAWRQRYAHATPFDGKGYFCFRSEGGPDEPDTLHVITTVPGLGAPLNPGASPWEELDDALALVGPWLEEAIERGGRPYSSSRGWEKDTLPKTESGFKFRARLEHIDDDYRQRILEDVQAECRGIPVPESDPSALHYRLYYKPGGWDSESLERFWSQREGYTLPGGERLEVVLGKSPAGNAQEHACEAPDGWGDGWFPDPFAGR